MALFDQLDKLKDKLDDARPLPEYSLASLREQLALEWTYHSNAIEGNTLTLQETRVVLEGITVGGKSVREHLEAINHRHAIDQVQRLVSGQQALSERAILELHELVLKGIDDTQAGRYRQQNVVITGASTRPPSHPRVRDEIAVLLDWHTSSNARALHPIARQATLHARFEQIHPFTDGNGRTGRLLLNLELMKLGWPPAIIRRKDRQHYYSALDQAALSGDCAAITELVASAVQRSLDLYLSVLEPEQNSPPSP